jgi:hypothetical protein
MEDKKLSEAEIEIIVDKICDKIERKFYVNVGQGLLTMVWKGFLLILVALAAYGAGIHFFK